MSAASSVNSGSWKTGRFLDEDLAEKIIETATTFGATYAEIRTVSNRNTSISMRDGKVRNAVPGHDVGATLRCLVDGSWGVHSTSDLSAIHSQVESTISMAKQVAARRTTGESPVTLAEVPISTKDVHWRPVNDIRDIDIEEKVAVLSEFDSLIRTDEKIVSVNTGFTDEHVQTELVTSEGMNRAWSFQRTCANAVVTGREDSQVASYRTRVGGVGGYEVIEKID